MTMLITFRYVSDVVFGCILAFELKRNEYRFLAGLARACGGARDFVCI